MTSNPRWYHQVRSSLIQDLDKIYHKIIFWDKKLNFKRQLTRQKGSKMTFGFRKINSKKRKRRKRISRQHSIYKSWKPTSWNKYLIYTRNKMKKRNQQKLKVKIVKILTINCCSIFYLENSSKTNLLTKMKRNWTILMKRMKIWPFRILNKYRIFYFQLHLIKITLRIMMTFTQWKAAHLKSKIWRRTKRNQWK